MGRARQLCCAAHCGMFHGGLEVSRHGLDLGDIWAFSPHMGPVAGGVLTNVDSVGSLGIPFMRITVFELEQNLEVIDS